jgi:hypothetical protein
MLRNIGKITKCLKKLPKPSKPQIINKFQQKLRNSIPKATFCTTSKSTEMRGVDRQGFNFKINENVGKFRIIEQKELKDFSTNLYLMKHELLGLHWFHFDSADLDNSFTMIFRTLPDDNSGKPHILEHTGYYKNKNN